MEMTIARNRIQFQKGLSEAQFQAHYGDEARSENGQLGHSHERGH